MDPDGLQVIELLFNVPSLDTLALPQNRGRTPLGKNTKWVSERKREKILRSILSHLLDFFSLSLLFQHKSLYTNSSSWKWNWCHNVCVLGWKNRLLQHSWWGTTKKPFIPPISSPNLSSLEWLSEWESEKKVATQPSNKKKLYISAWSQQQPTTTPIRCALSLSSSFWLW